MSSKEDWKINNNVKIELVKRWINPAKLKINTTKGNVWIKGELEFTGKAKDEFTTPVVIVNVLKQLDLVIRAIPNVKSTKYEIVGWNRKGTKWEQTFQAKKQEGE